MKISAKKNLFMNGAMIVFKEDLEIYLKTINNLT